MEKDIRNANAVTYKFESVLTKANNKKLEIAKKKRQKKRNGGKVKNKSYGYKTPKNKKKN